MTLPEMTASSDGGLLAAPGKKKLVVGLGKTGFSCAKFLANKGNELVVVDSREAPPYLHALQSELPEVITRLGDFKIEVLDEVEELIVSPGLPLDEPLFVAARERGLNLAGDIELFAQFAQAPIVAITGSNGKSTVTTLIAEMIKESGFTVEVGGNIGTPALELLERPVPDYYVLELSSFQLELTQSLNVIAGVVLNISADHLDRHATIEHYAQIKQQVYAGDGVMVLNRDDSFVAGMQQPQRQQIFYQTVEPQQGEFGLSEKLGEICLMFGDEKLLAASELKIVGKHNLSNALAALALGESISLPRLAMLQALKRFNGLEHRCQLISEFEGVRWYNDSKGTNVGATVAAIEGLPCKSVVILGGEGKGADFLPLKETLDKKARAVVLLGRDANLIKKVIPAELPIMHAENMMDAVAGGYLFAQQGDAVLLSPACASFDMFSDFVERGDCFISAVERLVS